ncbi:unnamed protein product [Acanthoscelides obtectus]|uniref:Protein sleepless n=1 Tax=Acanthoscelides obtectus TaxID=200917 RepID=A0A9P0P8I9_ACAOB|nr:unnamed protein product [Acanthoscelides obtectus]CAK1674927.1 hypothetical protein AOBTE_LOCUS29816 [Acanthoscelides obtectus]
MYRFEHLVGSLFIAMLCIESGAAISCYECNSAMDKRCLGDENNKLTNDLKKDCSARQTPDKKPYTLCRKIKQVIDFEVNGLQPDSRIIRTCGYEDHQYANRCYSKSGFGGRQEVCSCQTDSCNGSTAILASLALVLGSMIAKFQL